jgi:hypothetical protein
VQFATARAAPVEMAVFEGEEKKADRALWDCPAHTMRPHE